MKEFQFLTNKYPWQQQQDLTWHLLLNSIQNLLISPLIVVETLVDIQWHPRDAAESEALVYLETTNQATQEQKLFLPRLHGDFTTNKLLIDSHQEGWTSNYKGHIANLFHRSSFTSLQPLLEVKKEKGK